MPKKTKINPASKRICWECYCRADELIERDADYERTLSVLFYNRWNDGVVHCPEKARGGLTVFNVQLIEEAIRKCPKRFEHAVAAAAGESSKKS